jgi:hypothetical protein
MPCDKFEWFDPPSDPAGVYRVLLTIMDSGLPVANIGIVATVISVDHSRLQSFVFRTLNAHDCVL